MTRWFFVPPLIVLFAASALRADESASCFSSEEEDVVHYIEAGGDVNLLNGAGESCLMFVIEFSQDRALQLLLAKGADINYREPKHRGTAIIQAIGSNRPEYVRLLLDHGATVDWFLERMEDGWNLSPLHVAAFSRCPNLQIVQDLLKAGANPNISNSHIPPPLILVAMSERPVALQVADLLVKYGADVNWKDEDGRTPLMFAAEEAGLPMVRRLIRLGARVRDRDKEGKTALAYTKDPAVIRYLEVLLRD